MIYEIYHCYTKPEYRETSKRYVRTDMSKNELEKIYAGLAFHMEENTLFGEGYCVSEDVFAEFLRLFYNCEIIDNKKISEQEIYKERANAALAYKKEQERDDEFSDVSDYDLEKDPNEPYGLYDFLQDFDIGLLDIYFARECNICNNDCDEIIKDFLDTDFVKKLKAYYDDVKIFGLPGYELNELSIEEIQDRYVVTKDGVTIKN